MFWILFYTFKWKTNPYVVFGTMAFASDGEMGPYPLSNSMPPDGEMGPYPLSNSMPPDGEMGPYPLSDNTNLLGSNSYGVSLYRNYGSSYGTNYSTTNYYSAKYNNTKSQAAAVVASTCKNNKCSEFCDELNECSYRSHCSGDRSHSKIKCKTPVPTRRCHAKSERDSFRRHSAHGRMSSQGINNNTMMCKIYNI